MEIEVKGVLVNLLIIFLGQLMILLIHNLKIKGTQSKYQNKFSIFIASSISIILCMTFPFSIGGGYFYDLRFIPLIIGTLYGGLNVGVWLLIIINGYRLILGGYVYGIIFTATASLVVTIVAVIFYKKFHLYKPLKKLQITIGLLLMVPICTFLLAIGLKIDILPLYQWALHFSISSVGAILLIYFTEFINKHILLNEQMIHFEKSITVSHLAASIAHEVRNPLTTVKGFLQLLFIKEENEKRKSYYKTIFSELEKAENIIHDYLTYAKPKTQEVEVIDTKAEIEKTISILKPIANKANVQFQSDLQPLMTKGIVQHFQQALINIMKNAIEAMTNGGIISVYLKINNKKILLSICDTGHGLTKEQLMQLGKPYFSTKGENGTGLGLLVTYNVIEAMGGSIHVESEVDKGTCFHLSLPLEKNHNETLSEVASDVK